MGDVATWVSAIGTVSPVVVALFLVGREGRRRIRVERRYQAERITGWIAGGYRIVEGQIRFVADAIISNASESVVYRLIVTLVRDTRGETHGERHTGKECRRRSAWPGFPNNDRRGSARSNEGANWTSRRRDDVSGQDRIGVL